MFFFFNCDYLKGGLLFKLKKSLNWFLNNIKFVVCIFGNIGL